MKKLTLVTTLLLIAGCASAMAETKTWQVTEESAAGIKDAQGTWNVTTTDGKISGKAEMQMSDGTMMNYKIEGSEAGGVYTINLVDRTDGKKGCVWTGKAPTAGSVQTKGLLGYAPCDGGVKLIVRAAF